MGTMFFARDCAINRVRLPEFIEVVQMNLLTSVAYTPSRYNILRIRLLDDEMNCVEQHTQKRRQSLIMYGATICSNGWSDVKNDLLINFIIVCLEGEIFKGSIDASRHERPSNWMDAEMANIIEKMGQNW